MGGSDLSCTTFVPSETSVLLKLEPYTHQTFMSLQGTETHSKTPEDIVKSVAPATRNGPRIPPRSPLRPSPQCHAHIEGISNHFFASGRATQENTRGYRQKCSAYHEKWTTPSVLTDPLHNATPVTYNRWKVWYRTISLQVTQPCACHEKWTTPAVLTSPRSVSTLSTMPRLSRIHRRFNIEQFLCKWQSHSAAPVTRNGPRVRFWPPRIRFRPSPKCHACHVFGMFAFGFDPLS